MCDNELKGYPNEKNIQVDMISPWVIHNGYYCKIFSAYIQ